MTGDGERVVVLRGGGLPDTIEDHVDATAGGQRPHRLGKTVLSSNERIIAAMLASDPGFVLGADGSDDGGADVLCPLAKQ